MNTNRLSCPVVSLKALLAAGLASGLFPAALHALVFATTNEPAFPTGPRELPFTKQPGNRSVGWFSTFAGVVIAPNYALTVNHAGSQAGSVFYNDGKIFRGAESYSVAGKDLQVVRITNQKGEPANLRHPAALHSTNETVGAAIQVYGFGMHYNNGRAIHGRIPQVVVIEEAGGAWLGWDTSVGKKERWGHNRIKHLTPDRFNFSFDQAGQGDWIDKYECGVTAQDSGGPVFIGDQLAGIISQRPWPAGNQAIFGTTVWCERVSTARPAIWRPTRGTYAAPLAANETAIIEVVTKPGGSGVASVTFSRWGGAKVTDGGEIFRQGHQWRGYHTGDPKTAIQWQAGVVDLDEDLRGRPALGIKSFPEGAPEHARWSPALALPANESALLFRAESDGKIVMLPARADF